MPESRTATAEPTISRPIIPGYGVPEGNEGTLPWSHVEARMTEAKNYWIGTVDANGQPHSVPVWGNWIDGALYFEVGPRSSRNIEANSHVSVHLESGDQPVILEGSVERVTAIDSTISKRIDDMSAEKYNWRPSDERDTPTGEGSLLFRPRTVYAWTSFPSDATKWTFG